MQLTIKAPAPEPLEQNLLTEILHSSSDGDFIFTNHFTSVSGLKICSQTLIRVENDHEVRNIFGKIFIQFQIYYQLEKL